MPFLMVFFVNSKIQKRNSSAMDFFLVTSGSVYTYIYIGMGLLYIFCYFFIVLKEREYNNNNKIPGKFTENKNNEIFIYFLVCFCCFVFGKKALEKRDEQKKDHGQSRRSFHFLKTMGSIFFLSAKKLIFLKS